MAAVVAPGGGEAAWAPPPPPAPSPSPTLGAPPAGSLGAALVAAAAAGTYNPFPRLKPDDYLAPRRGPAYQVEVPEWDADAAAAAAAAAATRLPSDRLYARSTQAPGAGGAGAIPADVLLDEVRRTYRTPACCL